VRGTTVARLEITRVGELNGSERISPIAGQGLQRPLSKLNGIGHTVRGKTHELVTELGLNFIVLKATARALGSPGFKRVCAGDHA